MEQEKSKSILINQSAGESRPQNGHWWHFSLPWIGLILPALLLLLWWIGTAEGFINPLFLSTPVEVLKTLGHLLLNGELISDFWDSVRRMLLGTSIGLIAGLVLGGTTGYVRQVERVLDPLVHALRSIPNIAYIPILILAFGIDDAPKVALIAITIFFPTYINTYAGVRCTDQKLVELAQAYRLPRKLVLRRIILPSALPQIFVGFRLAATLAWIAAVLSEIMAGNSGLGMLLNDGRMLGRPDQTIALMLVLGVAGKSTDSLVCEIERRCTRWRTTFAGV
jgi:sulfonate transport system permease protein